MFVWMQTFFPLRLFFYLAQPAHSDDSSEAYTPYGYAREVFRLHTVFALITNTLPTLANTLP